MQAVGFSALQAEFAGLIAAAFMLFFMLLGARVADQINRRTVLFIASSALLVLALPYFLLINTHRFPLAALAEILVLGFVFGFGYGAIPTFYTENFPIRYRASGASAAYQISQVYGGGLLPIVAGFLLAHLGIHRAYLAIGLLVMLYAVLALIAIARTPENKDVDLSV
jgi:MFS family permease